MPHQRIQARISTIICDLTDPALLAGLALDAEADGNPMVDHLISDWDRAENRFDRRGERAYIAMNSGRVVAVCGLNVDSFAQDPTVGRVRRLYVATSHRRAGLGTVLLIRLIMDASPMFRSLHVRTHDVAASSFFESLGFELVENDAHYTHSYPVDA